MKRTGPTNPYLRKLIGDLKKKSLETHTPIWEDVAEKLNNSRRRRVEVNLSDIEKNAEKNDFVVVPGVVLSSGEITKPVNIAAWRFSGTAEEKIKKAKGKCLTIEEMLKEKPKGTGVKILV
jgi:large subunit ribosomal protein L18e